MTVLRIAVLCVLAVIHRGITQRREPSVQSWTEKTIYGTTLPSLNVCGKRITRFKRVINGSDASPGSFPWITALGYVHYETSRITWMCSGSLVTDRHIITAALCITDAPRGYVMRVARLGDLDLDDSVSDSATPKDYLVDWALPHPKFNRRTRGNNIGIVRLKSRVIFTYIIRPICLPTDDEFKKKNFTGYYAYVIGWGETAYQRQRTTRLQRTNVRIRNQEECKAMYEKQKALIDSKMVCAGGSGKDTCNGDLGCPLMVRHSTVSRKPFVNYFLYGIVSHGYRCGTAGLPGVYTRVSEFSDWILQNIQ